MLSGSIDSEESDLHLTGAIYKTTKDERTARNVQFYVHSLSNHTKLDSMNQRNKPYAVLTVS